MQLTVEQALQKAVAAQKRGNLNEAENIYRAILRREPNHPLANHNLGVIAVSLNLAGDALLLFKTALDANPTVEQFWVSYVDALVKAERPKDARQAIKKAKKTDSMQRNWVNYFLNQNARLRVTLKLTTIWAPCCRDRDI